MDRKILIDLLDDFAFGSHNIEQTADRITELYKQDQALQLLQTGVSGSNLQKYLVRYTQLFEAPHALLDDEVVIRSKVVEVSNPTEINDLVKNIVDIKQIF